MNTSADGYQWNPQEGFKTGVPTDAVILPKEFNVQTDKCYDAIVIGAGYAGLRALRDLSTQGRFLNQPSPFRFANTLKPTGYKTILLEGRDRIGGRSWTVKKDGYVYEVGGTWVHRNQAQVWTEIKRYGFANRLKDSQDFYEGSRTPTINRNGKLHQVPWTDQVGNTHQP
jgi:protoporphyrinogen oxidase